MEHSNEGLVGYLMNLPIFQAEWVLYLLLILSVVSVAVMVERTIFYLRHSVDIGEVRRRLAELLDRGDFAGAVTFLKQYDSLETNVVLFGLRDYAKGPESVEDLLTGAMSREKQRYERFLAFLATIGNNAPFIGLFGTVLGIIRAFKDLAGNMAEASGRVMYGISEALIATAVGLLVAIPAVIAYNVFKGMVKKRTSNTELLARTLLAQLKADPASLDEASSAEEG